MEGLETAGFQPNLRFHVVDQCLEEEVLVEPVVVEPESIVFLGGLKQPVDRGLAATLGIAGNVIVPEPSLARLAEVFPQVLHAENPANFFLDYLGMVVPDDVKEIFHPPYDVLRLASIIDEDAILVDTKRVLFWCLYGGEAIWPLEHTRWTL